MKKTRHLFAAAFLAVMIPALLVPLSADEGLWLFNAAPKDKILKKYGFAPTDEWLDHLRLSSIRFGGASGSFISPDGLVLTNFHVGQGAVQNLSSKERDLMKTGFYAPTRAEELKCPGMEVMVLQSIEDVTETIAGAEKPGMSPAQVSESIGKAISALEKERSEKTGLRCQVVTLYSGGLYHLYQYKPYTDIRLVFSPEFSIAFFGGDPANFTYPRYDLDICVFRLYENDKPVSSSHYLRWAPRGVRENDLVFCSGHPGSTGRLLTLAQLEFLRDTSYPFTLNLYKRRQALLLEYGKRGAEETRIALRNLFGIENGLKAITGYQSGLLDKKLMARKAAEEKAFREELGKTPALQETCGHSWDAIAEAQKAYASFYKAYTLFEGANGFYTSYFGIARNIVRLAAEKSKPNDQKLREFNETNLASVERGIFSPAPIYDELETIKLADSLALLKEEFGTLQEVRWLLGGKSASEAARELVSGTKLKDRAFRKALVAGGTEAVFSSEDPMIKLALLVDPLSRGLRARYEKEVSAVEKTEGARLARAMFRLKGTSFPPDATSTLRLSYGKVKGYIDNGKRIPFRTTFAGLYEKARKSGNRPPDNLPTSFLEKKAALNLNTPMNYVATCDSIGGNSGSPVVNKKGEFTGILFDGNIQCLPTRFVYEEEVSRSVMVHAQGILEALAKVYGAKPLVDEILGSAK